MPKKTNTPEQIINKLREAEILLSKGETVAAICKKIGITDQTYYRWRKDYGGMRIDQAKRLKDLEVENTRLKKLVSCPLNSFTYDSIHDTISLWKERYEKSIQNRINKGLRA